MSERITITIIDARRNVRWWTTLFSIVVSVVGPVLLGVLLESTAMQWVGFIFGLLSIMGIVYRDTNRNSFKSIEAAKARLDELTREQGE